MKGIKFKKIAFGLLVAVCTIPAAMAKGEPTNKVIVSCYDRGIGGGAGSTGSLYTTQDIGRCWIKNDFPAGPGNAVVVTCKDNDRKDYQVGLLKPQEEKWVYKSLYNCEAYKSMY